MRLTIDGGGLALFPTINTAPPYVPPSPPPPLTGNVYYPDLLPRLYGRSMEQLCSPLAVLTAQQTNVFLYYSSWSLNWGNNVTTNSAPAVDVLPGDIVLVKYGNGGYSASHDPPSISSTGPAMSWSLIVNMGQASKSALCVFAATASAAGNVGVTLTCAQANAFGFVVEVWRNSSGVGAIASGYTSPSNNQEAIHLTTSGDDSGVSFSCVDFSAGSATPVWLTVNGSPINQVYYNNIPGAYTVTFGSVDNAGTHGSNLYGLNNISGNAALCAIELLPTGAAPPPPPPPSGLAYPRTGGLFNGGDQSYAPTPYSSQASGQAISASGFFKNASPGSNPVPWMGRFDVALIGGNYEGWSSGSTYDRGLLVDAMQEICNVSGFTPVSVWQYVDYDDRITSGVSRTNAPEESFYPTIDSKKWLLYNSPNQGGSPVPNFFGNGNTTNWSVAWPGTVNGVAADEGISPGRTTSPYDSLSEDFMQSAAAYFTELYICRHSTFNGTVSGSIAASKISDSRYYPNLVIGPNYDANKAPNLAGIFVDNQFIYPRDSGYYNLASSYGNSATSPSIPWLSRGHQHFKKRMKDLVGAAYPGRPFSGVGNIGTLFFAWQSAGKSFAPLSGALDGYQDGGLWEAPSSALFNTDYGTAETILAAQAVVNFMSGKQQLVISMTMASATDYQTARFWIGISLMAGCYVNCQYGGNYNFASNVWLDEFGGNPGTNIGKGWLGQPKAAAPTSAAINGVWIRDFDNGVVLCNPTGNGSQTITLAQINSYLGSSYSLKFFQGVQDTSLNSGAAFSSHTLAAADSVLLLKA